MENPEVPSEAPGLLIHRYMPCVGREHKGIAEAEYPVFVDSAKDAEAVRPRIKSVRKAESATFQIDALNWSQLPTLHHIVSRLAEIPVYEVVDARVVEGEGVVDVASARQIQHLE